MKREELEQKTIEMYRSLNEQQREEMFAIIMRVLPFEQLSFVVAMNDKGIFEKKSNDAERKELLSLLKSAINPISEALPEQAPDKSAFETWREEWLGRAHRILAKENPLAYRGTEFEEKVRS